MYFSSPWCQRSSEFMSLFPWNVAINCPESSGWENVLWASYSLHSTWDMGWRKLVHMTFSDSAAEDPEPRVKDVSRTSWMSGAPRNDILGLFCLHPPQPGSAMLHHPFSISLTKIPIVQLTKSWKYAYRNTHCSNAWECMPMMITK